MIIGAFSIVFGSMLWIIENFSLSIPYYDEWDAEADWLYRHYEDGNLGISSIFTPHNGHRLILTRLTALALYALNGGWDPQLQMIVSALLHATTCIVLIRFFLMENQRSCSLLPILSTVILFAIPFSWISITVAFQTQFYFMILFSILALRSLINSQYLPGYMFSVLAMSSMTPGAFVLPAFASAIIARAFQSRKLSRNQILQCAISIFLFYMFVLTLHEDPAAKVYFAQHIQGFFISLLAAFSWPYRISLGIGFVIYVPLAFYLIRSITTSRGSLFLFSLGIFMVCQILAMAYFRGGEGVPPANRYWEIMIIGIWLNGMCAWHMTREKSIQFPKRFAISWLLLTAIGLANIGYQSLSDGLPDRKADSLATQSLILEFLETGNRDVILEKTPSQISHSNANSLVMLLEDEQVREFLPSSLGGNSQDRVRLAKVFLFYMAPVILILGCPLFAYSIIKIKVLKKRKEKKRKSAQV